jgi:hypothetical protein
MKVLVFSFVVFLISPLLFSETLTSREVDAIVRTDPIRADTERSIMLIAGMLAANKAPSRVNFYSNFMRAYAWVMNDMHTGTNTVYNLGTYFRNILRSAPNTSLDTYTVTTTLLTYIMMVYEDEDYNESDVEKNIIALLAFFHFMDSRAQGMSEDDPVFKGWMAQAEGVYRKIINLANQL